MHACSGEGSALLCIHSKLETICSHEFSIFTFSGCMKLHVCTNLVECSDLLCLPAEELANCSKVEISHLCEHLLLRVKDQCHRPRGRRAVLGNILNLLREHLTGKLSTTYYTIMNIFYPYLRHVGSTSLQYRISWIAVGNGDSFNVATSSTHTMPSYHALKFTWGEHWIYI